MNATARFSRKDCGHLLAQEAVLHLLREQARDFSTLNRQVGRNPKGSNEMYPVKVILHNDVETNLISIKTNSYG